MDRRDLELFTEGIRHATETQSGQPLDDALAQLGWRDALTEHPAAAVSVLFECQGSANTTSSALERVLLFGAGIDDGNEVLAACLPAFGMVDMPAVARADHVLVEGLALAGVDQRGRMIATAAMEGMPRAIVVPQQSLTLRPVSGIDPALGLVEVHADIDLGAVDVLGPASWDDAVALAQLALGHELVGAARATLELARQHALERVQFGRTISTFQAVRHRLADSFVAVEAAAALLDEAWQDLPAFGAMAKAFAGRQARTVARHAQQVLAGIGFTAEHPLHAYVRRIMVLDQLLGAGTLLTRRLGSTVLGTGVLPREFPL
jgi:Acyl-CoA dehydrogenase, C-terminal domain